MLLKKDKNSQEGLEYLKKAASLGEVDSMSQLAEFYQDSDERPQEDFDLSLCYSMQAYNNGDLNAMNYIYNLLLKKKIQQKNMPNAIEFIKKAADLGDTIAMVAYVTYLTNNCEPTPEVLNDQIHYSKLAADKGNTQGMLFYGFFLQIGLGIERNIPEAVHYYKMAADLGHPVAQLYYNQLIKQFNDYQVNQIKSVANSFNKLIYETLSFMKNLKEIENAAAKNTNDSNNNPVNDSNQNNLNDDSISSSLSSDSNYNLDRNITNKNINQNTVPQKKIALKNIHAALVVLLLSLFYVALHYLFI